MATSSVGTSRPENDEYWRYIPLYQAALRGDWASAQRFFEEDEGALTAKIKSFGETTLHIAVGAGRSTSAINFVRNLADKMPPEALEIVNDFNRTALFNAAWMGNMEVVQILWQKRPSLVYMRDKYGCSPLDMAASNAMKDTLLYLLDVTKNDPFSKLFPVEDSAALLLISVITSGYYDIALYLVEKYPGLAVSKRKSGDCGLKGLARKISAFKSGSRHQWWQRVIYDHVPVKLNDFTMSRSKGDIENAVDDPRVMGHNYKWAARLLVEYFCITVPCIKHIQEQKGMHLQALKLLKCLCERVRSLNDSNAYESHVRDAINSAAKLGIHEVIEEIVESFPISVWARDKEGRNLFQRAVIERHANVFNLIYQMGDYRRLIVYMKDGSGNNLLHLAGGLAPPNKLNLVSGAALQIQRELQWFQEVKMFANPEDIDWPNSHNETPAMLFTREHKKLVAEGETWMKDTANSCTIPSALIVTMVFAAAITVPGGINDTGLPIFSKDAAFKIFVISDAVSLFASITSLLVVLSILTSRYAEGDFLFVLPNRLIIGLATLFLSITAMVIAFSSALYLLFGSNDKVWILYPVVALAFIPILSFTFLQFPLLRDLMVSTYRPRIFGKQSNRAFY
ncbi:hypothetical protein RHMOL_Rhmol04G0240800 [Rhododendron molle]|uniref:Uncharacterized protein n=3 Tax=Rhododendron molle TaxID=49168 RepID=A0ACC0P4W5_RHOML|nr:hypothetical protein RHMOL_Rhmol04G0240800 [Rhododendron molle]KAI8560248.1 hypothetical protein RHMOL_Rhmol04G0240800 [Rhododendron molle]KAI8560249.1 hypothetical protein RHMOL_Rhmol04G0240800 [Rhododendron molle]